VGVAGCCVKGGRLVFVRLRRVRSGSPASSGGGWGTAGGGRWEALGNCATPAGAELMQSYDPVVAPPANVRRPGLKRDWGRDCFIVRALSRFPTRPDGVGSGSLPPGLSGSDVVTGALPPQIPSMECRVAAFPRTLGGAVRTSSLPKHRSLGIVDGLCKEFFNRFRQGWCVILRRVPND